MAHEDQRVDAYIEKSADFAKPILKRIRAMAHELCPELEETMKWSFPNFVYRGANLCGMAAFKQHCAFGFAKAELLDDPSGLLTENGVKAMGHFGRIQSLKDLPSKATLKPYFIQAMKLNEDGVKVPRPKTARNPKDIVVPKDLQKALSKNTAASLTFSSFSPSHKREYIDWIESAKREETRLRRLESAVQMMSEGKSQNWKYERKNAKS